MVSGWSIAITFPTSDSALGCGTSSRVCLIGLVMATIVVELLYMLIRQTPQHWWIIAWAFFLG